MDFITILTKLQEDCGAANLKMSGYGIRPQDFPILARNAKDTMGGLFACDRVDLTPDDCVAICSASYA